MTSYIAISNSIGSLKIISGSGSSQRIVSEVSHQIVTEASSQNMITEQ